jgi:hypothetical protein
MAVAAEKANRQDASIKPSRHFRNGSIGSENAADREILILRKYRNKRFMFVSPFESQAATRIPFRTSFQQSNPESPVRLRLHAVLSQVGSHDQTRHSGAHNHHVKRVVTWAVVASSQLLWQLPR